MFSHNSKFLPSLKRSEAKSQDIWGFFLKKIGDDNDNDATENEEMCGIFFWHTQELGKLINL